MEAFDLILLLVCILGFTVIFYLLNRIRGSKHEDFSPQIEQLRTHLELTTTWLKEDLGRMRSELLLQYNQEAKNNRDELGTSLNNFSHTLTTNLSELNKTQRSELETLRQATESKLGTSLKAFSDTLSASLNELSTTQRTEFESLRKATEDKLSKIQKDNEERLEKMRQTVDEKLHNTLETRLGESFKLVSERLEQVQRGLGEMQVLAKDVGNLQKVLSNVKNRGFLGEVQLEMLLEQLLTPEQYEKNFKPYKRRDEVVEFAIRLPGRDEDNSCIYLPIDAKFPIEDYQRLTDAYDTGNLPEIDKARKDIFKRIKDCAKDIRDKYINPPITTDFALLFLPLEGLYAEILRQSGAFESIQRDYHVIIVGPTTISAILNSLQLGFRTLAIEKRSSEVWKLLSAIKSEFGKFGTILDHTRKKLQEAGNVIEKASHRSRQIERKLKGVQELPAEESKLILDLSESDDGDLEDDSSDIPEES